MESKMYILKAGTTIYHGTDNSEYDEESSNPHPYSWFSTSRTVAERFAKRSGGWGGTQRVIAFELVADVVLHEIMSTAQRQEFAEEHNIDFSGVEEMRESAEAAGISGWIIPANYPEGDDILIGDTSLLDYVDTTTLAYPAGHVPTAEELTRLADKLEASSTLMHGSAYAPTRQAEKLLRHLVRHSMSAMVVEGLEANIEQLRRMAGTVASPARERMLEAATMLEALNSAELFI
jgi:hypothetical protein